jgi:uncharacterized membrane protein YfcA
MIFSGAISSFFMNIQHKHPLKESIVIDYNIPYIIVPFLLFGTMIGVTLNKVFPPWIILISLTMILIINTVKTIRKANKLSLEEKSNERNLNFEKNQHHILREVKEAKNSNDKNSRFINLIFILIFIIIFIFIFIFILEAHHQ